MKPVLSIEIDALSKIYITKDDTPFLYELKSESYIADLQTNLTFFEYIDSFTGLYPQDTNTFSTFYYDKNSTYKWLNYFMFIRYIDNGITRLIIDIVTNIIRLIKKRDNFISISSIPIKNAPLFNASINKQICNNTIKKRTLFDILKVNNIKYCYINLPVICTNKKTKYALNSSDKNAIKKAIKMSKYNYAFYHIYLRGIDDIIHKYGINSNEVKKRMSELDKLIEKLTMRFRNSTLIIYSLHGMIPVKNKINLLDILKNSRLKPNKDYILFIDSTIARFWFMNNQAKKEVTNLLKNIKGGHILTQNELIKYKINFKDNKYGDLIFLADPGTIILPNYFQGSKTVKAMHGYKPIKELDGFFIYNNKNTKYKKLKRANITKLYGTFLKSLNLSYKDSII